MVTVSTVSTQPVQKAENGNEMARILQLIEAQQAEIASLKSQAAEQKAAPVKSAKRELTLNRADFRREAKPIEVSASNHLPNLTLKPSINQNGTWMWSYEDTAGEVELGGQVVKAIIKLVVYVSGSKDRQ